MPEIVQIASIYNATYWDPVLHKLGQKKVILGVLAKFFQDYWIHNSMN